ncbi:MAG: putative phosphoribosyl transferase [Thermoplasmata archaeon]|jgi:putative phosphoribosyl transferase|nr:putative phosphoribosyl transferase [Thermoplasmata archaeon]
MPYRDRVEAGRILATHLRDLAGPGTLVIGLARGGVPVAAEVAHALGAPLDVMVARKLGAPGNPEFGVGAVAPGGVRVVDEGSLHLLGMLPEQLDQVIHDEEQEMERRLLLYRGDPRAPDVRGKTVILVDDGLATGVTAHAALDSLRAQRPRRLVLAVPVGAPDSVQRLARLADQVVCPEQPEDFRAVGLWYDDFAQTTDEEVLGALPPRRREARIATEAGDIIGDLTVPRDAKMLVVFAHGSGSGRMSPRNRAVARRLESAGLATLLLDLLTEREEREQDLRFDIPLLARRVVAALAWVRADEDLRALPLGIFGASTGAAAALVAAASHPVAAVVSRGGRPDLAADALADVEAATLLIVGGDDEPVIGLNEEAFDRMRCEKRLEIVPGATHLFEEPGALDRVADLAAAWFVQHATVPRQDAR